MPLRSNVMTDEGDGNAAFLFDLHPVGAGAAAFPARADLTGCPDRTARQEQLFRQRRLTGIGVGNDRKGAPGLVRRRAVGGHQGVS
jgi:hypothetical protein